VRLIDLKSRYSDEYPDVIKTQVAIKELEARLAATGKEAQTTKPDNPAYITMASQLAGTRTEIQSVQRQIKSLRQKRDSYRQRVEAAPRVEEGYRGLVVDRNNLQAKFEDLNMKSMDAEVAYGMEKEQLGEKFSIVEPARLPEKPDSPNVPATVIDLMANDPTVKAGSWGARTVEKIVRLTEYALRHELPVFWLVDSAGARITDQVELFPGRRGAGRIFANQVRLSGKVPQACCLFGPSAAGGAYIPSFCDFVIMVEGNASMYLGSPRMAEEVIGERVTLEEMGGARMHASVSGCGDNLARDDAVHGLFSGGEPCDAHVVEPTCGGGTHRCLPSWMWRTTPC
jgi:hypothetical protein